MSRVVRGLGPAPDGRGINTPKEIRKYKRATRLFRGAEKAFNLIKKLRKNKRKQRGTPAADRIQQRINRLKERKDRLLEKSRSINYRDRPKDYGANKAPNPRYEDFDKGRGRDRGRDRGIDRGRDKGRDRGGEDRGRRFFGGRDKDGGRKSTGGLFGGSREFSSKKGRSGRVYVQSTEKKDDREERG
tara:strand:+ start:64 stop:624 length:561 start_codon:yes stop_codon:yes gene_type:complete